MRNARNLIKDPGVVASVADFGWWTASDIPKELTFQLWLKINEKCQKPDKRPPCFTFDIYFSKCHIVLS